MPSIIAIVASFIIILFRNHHQFQCAQNSSPLCFSGLWTFFTYFVSFDLCGISHVLLNYSSYKHHVWLWTLNMSWDLTFGVISKKHLLLEAYCPSFLALFRLYTLHTWDIISWHIGLSFECFTTINSMPWNDLPSCAEDALPVILFSRITIYDFPS